MRPTQQSFLRIHPVTPRVQRAAAMLMDLFDRQRRNPPLPILFFSDGPDEKDTFVKWVWPFWLRRQRFMVANFAFCAMRQRHRHHEAACPFTDLNLPCVCGIRAMEVC